MLLLIFIVLTIIVAAIILLWCLCVLAGRCDRAMTEVAEVEQFEYWLDTVVIINEEVDDE